jgi:vacuolar-type H+-ATPase subunit B/Vma2
MLNEGVDMMGGIRFMVSAVHREMDIDRTADSFERSFVSLNFNERYPVEENLSSVRRYLRVVVGRTRNPKLIRIII